MGSRRTRYLRGLGAPGLALCSRPTTKGIQSPDPSPRVPSVQHSERTEFSKREECSKRQCSQRAHAERESQTRARAVENIGEVEKYSEKIRKRSLQSDREHFALNTPELLRSLST